MAMHQDTFHTCDICGVKMEKPYNGGERGTYALTASADYAVVGHSISLKEMCGPCNDWLGRHIDDLLETVRAMRHAR